MRRFTCSLQCVHLDIAKDTGSFPFGFACRVFRMSGILPRRIVGKTAALSYWLITFDLCLSNRASATAPEASPQTLRVEARDLITDAPVREVLFKLSVSGGMKFEASSDADGIARFRYTLPEATGRHSFLSRLGATASEAFCLYHCWLRTCWRTTCHSSIRPTHHVSAR